MSSKTTTIDVICIGDELLIGQTIDTNSAWMGQQLNLIGARIQQISAISDSREQILQAVKDSEERSDIVLITGGLGPTNDDITKETLCEYFDTELEVNKEVLSKIEDHYSKRGLEILQINRLQASLPKNCTALHNSYGTASGMWFERNGKIIVSMPGVPLEMKGIMSNEVLPRLKKLIKNSAVVHKTILTEGIGESFLANLIKDWEESLKDEDISIAYLPSFKAVKIRLSAYGTSEKQLKEKINRKFEELKDLIPDFYLAEDDGSLQESIGKLLKGKGKTISTAESCTGGYLAHLITSVPECSSYFKGSVVSYDNEVKINQLLVHRGEIERYGAVSKSVVEQMAMGAKQVLETDFALATSGVAGPDGGTEEKPVGTVWIALAHKDEVISKKFLFVKDRMANIELASNAALSMLRKHLMKDEK